MKNRDESKLTIFEEGLEACSLSLLVYLCADVRLLSCTGRSFTKFERLAVESDFLPRATANQLSGIQAALTYKDYAHEDDENVDNIVESLLENKGKDSHRFTSIIQQQLSKEKNEGLSTAYIMAVMLLELRKSIKEYRNNEKKFSKMFSRLLEEEDNVASEMDQTRGKVTNETVHDRMRHYSFLLSNDLVKDVKIVNSAFVRDGLVYLDAAKNQIEATTNDFKNAVTGLTGILEEPDEFEDAKEKEEEKEENKPVGGKKDPVKKDSVKKGSVTSRDLRGSVTDRIFVPDPVALRPRPGVKKMSRATKDFRVDLMETETEERLLTEKEILLIVERAVERRDYSKLHFVSDMFQPGSTCHHLSKSNAKLVWMNDWYPLKDLTYALLVDSERKRIIVTFRGCTTVHDWKYAFDYETANIDNPISEDYDGKSSQVDVHNGFYKYLFRKRKDTDTTKYDEVCNVVHRYGFERIGPDYTVYVIGHSMGAALSTLFSFHAACDERFVKNGPIKVVSFSGPYVGGHRFADAFRHLEKTKKIEYARFYCHNDVVAHIPFNISITKRGSAFRHVGIGIKLKPTIIGRCCFGAKKKWQHDVYYHGNENALKAYGRALGRNALLSLPLPTRIVRNHLLQEIQARLMDHLRIKNLAKDDEVLSKLDMPIATLYEEYFAKKIL